MVVTIATEKEFDAEFTAKSELAAKAMAESDGFLWSEMDDQNVKLHVKDCFWSTTPSRSRYLKLAEIAAGVFLRPSAVSNQIPDQQPSASGAEPKWPEGCVDPEKCVKEQDCRYAGSYSSRCPWRGHIRKMFKDPAVKT